MIKVARLKNENAAELFFGFSIGSIGCRDPAVLLVQRQRRLGRLERYFGNEMSVCAQMVVIFETLVE
jgi:hypothetical protein